MDAPRRERSVEAWLNSSLLERLVARVALDYNLSPDDIPDLVQETRLAIWETAQGTEVTARLVARIARHKAVDMLRRLIRSRVRDQAMTALNTPPVENSELRHLLNVRISGLPGEFQKLFELHYRQGLSEREIAREWGICRSSVRWLNHRCRELVCGSGTHEEPRLLRVDRDRRPGPER